MLWASKKTNQWIIKHIRVLTRDTKDQAVIILLWTHVKTQFSEEDFSAGKGRRKGKKRMASNTVDGLSYNGDGCPDVIAEGPG